MQKNISNLGNTPDNNDRVVGCSYQNCQVREAPIIVSPNGTVRVIKPNTPPIHITPYCICRQGDDPPSRALSWLFSVVTILLCVVFPLTSFVADVTFFVICSDHYNETKQLQDDVKQGHLSSSHSAYSNQVVEHKYDDVNHEEINFFPQPFQTQENKNNINNTGDHSDSTYKLFPVQLKETKIQNISSTYQVNPDPNFNNEGTGQKINNFIAIPQLALLAENKKSEKYFIDSVISAQCYTDTKISVCNDIPELLDYIRSDEAARQLEEHRRVTSDVFEPVFIIGSFPCLVFSVFSRLVIMVTNHDHFLSAFVTNMASMPLQLVTGALAVHSASYHVGQNGFECWRCASERNCSSVAALSFIEDHVTMSLIGAIIAKFFDGVAGGCVLFVVLTRLIWLKNHSVTWRWYICRVSLLLISFSFCVTVSSTMVLTPSLGVFRLEMMEKTAQFRGKNNVCYGSMVVLAMGLTAWGFSILGLVIYSCFKTYVFCRVKDDPTNKHEV